MATRVSVQDIFEPSHKIPLTWTSFLAYIFPAQLCLYLMGVLVQLKGTQFYRIAFLPVLIWFAWHGAFVDMSGGNPRLAMVNTVSVSVMCGVALRGIAWTVAREPFRRYSPADKPDKTEPERVYTVCWNAWDLMFTTRGIGWNWPHGLIVPKPIFETDSRVVFALLSTARLAIHALGFDACIQTIRFLFPDTIGSLNGGTLFDHSLPPHLQLSRAVVMSFMAVWTGYFAMEWSYQFLAIISIVLFQQQPSQWPPLFDSPWLSTSLTEFWGRRWHQMMRETVVVFGLRPFSYLFGRFGGTLAAFLVSGIFHDIELRAFGHGGNSVAIVGFWAMNGIGVALERVWLKTTGRRVGGVWGRVWTFGWLAVWSVWMVDAWARTGRLGSLALPGEIEPSVALVGFIRRYVQVA